MTRGRVVIAIAIVTVITAWFSYGIFHGDEYFQTIELARYKLAPAEVPLLPWEYGARIRSWLQPLVYVVIGRGLGALGVHDLFGLALAYRLVTGLANVGALVLFLRTTLAWQDVAGQSRQLRGLLLFGFLPYLFVRTSSESASAAALTTAFALLFEGARSGTDGRAWSVPVLAPGREARQALVGVLFGVAFELRFQTALVGVGVLAWTIFVGALRARSALVIALGGIVALVLGAVVDRWGYGEWALVPWRYFRINLIEGVAESYGTDLPLAYLWLSPANVFMPAVAAVLVVMVVAWLRAPRHPLTWATLPFVLVHNLLPHKEERFLFPIAILVTGLVPLALAPDTGTSRMTFVPRLAERRMLVRALVAASLAPMVLLAFFPLGWNEHVRFTHALHDRFGDEIHVAALPELDIHFPAYHPRVYDVEQTTADELARRVALGTSKSWLVVDDPILRTGTSLDETATLEWSELVGFGDPAFRARAMRWVDAYNAWERPPLRPLRFRSLYRVRRDEIR